MFIDTHCHLSKEDYDDINKVISENRIAGIDKIIISGCSKNSIEESIDISELYDDVFVTIGYHPDEASQITDDDLINLDKLLNHRKIVGVGEIGLDYHYSKELVNEQKALFHKQLYLAEKHNLPVVIHSRDATEDTISILKQHPNVHGVIHCFSGSLETARTYIKMGFYLGIGGVVTFKNSKLGTVIKEVGLDHIVLETDSPYLTPEPNRGKKNSSKYIPDIAKKIAELLGVSLEKVSEKTIYNTICLFDLR